MPILMHSDSNCGVYFSNTHWQQPLDKQPLDLTHRVGRHAEVGLDVGLCFGLHRLLRLQDLLHWHVLVSAAGGLHLVLVLVLGSLALLLNSCM